MPTGRLFFLRSTEMTATLVAQGSYSLDYEMVSQPACFVSLNCVVMRRSSLLGGLGSARE